ncbi:MAG: phage Gp37/Gp68 family protein [Hydrogenophaga sp.]|jgi:protein gp37|uniref:phage Gp37/Gp68 family protein n=1 Tax=Hydrogenophaga sp. TaxID=1904254 RepID=UPI0027262C3C|nr:phage Gp37/Gp68 family protein [Hydrogenophaga sp.]MDO9571143.1 phage Gp37/Gp68 family protein [Hydrogenophaga sp.]MDP3372985.1 phage Gp37/Gp68 family protein [Hydrogenophaga sp.]
MTKNTKIEWAHHTFNPWIGCTKVGPGCDNCYAEADFSTRRKVVQWGAGHPRKHTAPSTWAQPLRWNAEAERLGVRYRVFCASLADVFDNEVPVQWRIELMSLILKTPNLDWLLLTKRVGNALPMMKDAMVEAASEHGQSRWPGLAYWIGGWWDGKPPANVWLGATITSQTEADRDIPKLLAVPAAKRFLSMEPLLGPVDLTRHFLQCCGCFVPGRPGDGWMQPPDPPACCGDLEPTELDWVIVGGESGPNARPMHPDWARSLRDQCQAVGVPLLFKQWGEWRQATDGELCKGYEFIKVGKKAAGRLLDGVEHNGVPA